MAHLPDLTVAGQGASPQPPIRRHHPGELASAGGTGGEPTYVQTSHGPVAYGYVQGQPTGTLPMHSPNPAASVIYGNFEEAPQGYLDRYVFLRKILNFFRLFVFAGDKLTTTTRLMAR